MPERRWAVLLIASAASFMSVLDVSIVNVALPSIRSGLHLGAGGMAWVVNAYTITFAGFLLAGGRAGDLFGRRPMFFLGLGLFVAGSLAGALAQDGTTLIVARAVQGVGGGVLSPTTLGIVTTTYTAPADRARALGVWSAVAGCGAVSGAIAGGLLTDLLSWRWVLAVNVPIGLLLWLPALRALHPPPPHVRVRDLRQLDLLGAATATAGMIVLTYAIVGTDRSPWTSARTVAALLLAAGLLGAFVAVERRSVRPMVPLGVFRRANVGLPVTVSLLFGAASFSMYYLLSLLLQEELGYSPLAAGMGFLPLTAGTVAGSMLAGRLLRRLAARSVLAAGLVLQAAGFGTLGASPASGSYAAHVLGPTLATGFGIGLLMVSLTGITMAGVAPEETGLVSGLLNTGRQAGGALGLAVLATVATSAG